MVLESKTTIKMKHTRQIKTVGDYETFDSFFACYNG